MKFTFYGISSQVLSMESIVYLAITHTQYPNIISRLHDREPKAATATRGGGRMRTVRCACSRTLSPVYSFVVESWVTLRKFSKERSNFHCNLRGPGKRIPGIVFLGRFLLTFQQRVGIIPVASSCSEEGSNKILLLGSAGGNFLWRPLGGSSSSDDVGAGCQKAPTSHDGTASQQRHTALRLGHADLFKRRPFSRLHRLARFGFGSWVAPNIPRATKCVFLRCVCARLIYKWSLRSPAGHRNVAEQAD